jgi:hypothetical protein
MAGFTKPQMPGAFGQSPFQGPGAIPGVPGTQQPTQVIKNVSTQTDMLKLVNSLAAQEKLATGRALQARGQRTMDTPKYLGGLKNDKSYRNILAGALESHWGRQDVQQGLDMNQQAIEDERARSMAARQQKADAVYEWAIAQGASEEQARAAAQMALSGEMPDLEGLGKSDYDLDAVNSLQRDHRVTIGQDFAVRTEAARDIISYAQRGTGFGDHALIFRYMKFLDPTSTVRDSEYGEVVATGDWGDRAGALINSVLNGKKLTEEQRKDLVQTVVSTYPGYVEAYEKRSAPYKRRAEAAGVPWNHISATEPLVIPDDLGTSTANPEPRAKGPGATDAAVQAAQTGTSQVEDMGDGVEKVTAPDGTVSFRKKETP